MSKTTNGIKEWMDKVRELNKIEQKPYYIFKGTMKEFFLDFGEKRND